MTASAPGRAAALLPVLCVIADGHQDMAVADAACAGRYTHAGVELELGTRPDWLGCGLPHDEEWRIEFVKLYEGLDLAHAYAETGDARYLATWIDLVDAFIAQVPVGTDTSDVSARRIQNWLYAGQRFAAVAPLDESFARRLRDRLEDDLAHLRAHLTAERNHRTLELYALLLADLALDARGRAADDLALLADNAATDIWPDGVQRECSSDYHLIVLRSLVGALLNARAAGLDVPAALRAGTDRAATFARWLHRPDGTTPALSDGDQGDFRALLALAADALERPDLAWVATGGASGTAPTETAATFATGGYVLWRSGWRDPDERWGVLDCGPIGDGGHGHYDQLSVELVDGDAPLVLDPGRYTYADGPDGWRRAFKGTAAHNTVCVDGLDQIPYRRGRPKGELSRARLVARRSAAGLDVARATVESPCYDAVHTRTVAFVRGRYWLVHDVVEAPTRHAYAIRWHLDPRCDGAVRVAHGRDQHAVDGPGVRLLVEAAAGAETVVAPGWVSPTYGVRVPAPVVVTSLADARALDVVTLVAGREAPARLDVARTAGRLEVRVVDGRGVDVVRLERDLAAVAWERTGP